MGVDISTIRSLQIDWWTDKQILYLSQGGNFKLQKILEEYSIDPKDPVEKNINLRAGDYYRKYLKNLVEKISDPDYVQVELSYKLLDRSIYSNINIYIFNYKL